MYDYTEKDFKIFAEEYFVNNFFDCMLNGGNIYKLKEDSEKQGFLRELRLEFELEG